MHIDLESRESHPVGRSVIRYEFPVGHPIRDFAPHEHMLNMMTTPAAKFVCAANLMRVLPEPISAEPRGGGKLVVLAAPPCHVGAHGIMLGSHPHYQHHHRLRTAHFERWGRGSFRQAFSVS